MVQRPMEIKLLRDNKCLVHWPDEEKCQNPAQATIGVGITYEALGLVQIGNTMEEVLHIDVPMCMDCSHRLRELIPVDGRYLSIRRPDPELAKAIADKAAEIAPLWDRIADIPMPEPVELPDRPPKFVTLAEDRARHAFGDDHIPDC